MDISHNKRLMILLLPFGDNMAADKILKILLEKKVTNRNIKDISKLKSNCKKIKKKTIRQPKKKKLN